MDLVNGVVPIGDLDFYGGTGAIPEGDYSLNFDFRMYAGQKKDGSQAGPQRLGCMVAFHDLNDPEYRGDKTRTKFYSFGSNVDKSYMPNPEDGGKTLLLRENAPVVKLNDMTNWKALLQSFYDCGMERGIFVGDVSVLDGVHAHTQNQAEPEERKGFASAAAQTGDAAPSTEPRRAQTIPVVSEILAAPWRGDACGLPEDAPKKGTAKAAPAKAAPVKAATKPNGAVKAAPVPVKEADADEDVMTAAQIAAAEVLGKNQKGCAEVILRTQTFKAVSKASGEEMATKVIETFFDNGVDALNGLLSTLDFVTDGKKVSPAA